MIIILDYGSQYTQIIARRVRELNVFSVIEPFNAPFDRIRSFSCQGIILSGGPLSVYDQNAPSLDKRLFDLDVPVLGICYGMQVLACSLGGSVASHEKREYGKAVMYLDDHKDLFFTLPAVIKSWMSHGDSIVRLPKGFARIAHTVNTPFAAIADKKRRVYGVQFHPEVGHTEFGLQIISNFLFRICGCRANWKLDDLIDKKINFIKRRVRKGSVICGLSGGVDSSVTAVLIHRAIGKRLNCIFVNNGLLRKNEVRRVINVFSKHFNINLDYVNASKSFLSLLKDVTDPEKKRKLIGHEFIRVFEEEAKKIEDARFLAQGTLYPDVVESVSFFGGPTAKIKSHHNVGGLPEKMKLRLIEPLRDLFKDEVREIGKKLGIASAVINRHPFPGPGLAVRILGNITRERVRILKEVDWKIEKIIKRRGLYGSVWQAFSVLLPLRTVGVMGDKRTYEYVVGLRAVTSLDGMTADWARIPYDVLEEISTTVINTTRGVNRVVYDISSKPPATIEWE